MAGSMDFCGPIFTCMLDTSAAISPEHEVVFNARVRVTGSGKYQRRNPLDHAETVRWKSG